MLVALLMLLLLMALVVVEQHPEVPGELAVAGAAGASPR
jgi:hypothetical protein